MKKPALTSPMPMPMPAAAPSVMAANPGNSKKAAIVQKPHNPANHLSQMPTYGNGGKVMKGYAGGGMVKGKKGC